MKAILLTESPFSSIYVDPSLSGSNGQLFLDWQIERLEQLKYEVVVVLGGDLSDVLLRRSQKLHSCEIVYDTSDSRCLMSNLRAGLYTVHRESFALPLATPCPAPEVWHALLKHFYSKAIDKKVHLVRPFYPQKGELIGGFPLLISREGKRFIKNNAPKNLECESLQISRMPTLEEGITSLVNVPASSLAPTPLES